MWLCIHCWYNEVCVEGRENHWGMWGEIEKPVAGEKELVKSFSLIGVLFRYRYSYLVLWQILQQVCLVEGVQHSIYDEDLRVGDQKAVLDEPFFGDISLGTFELEKFYVSFFVLDYKAFLDAKLIELEEEDDVSFGLEDCLWRLWEVYWCGDPFDAATVLLTVEEAEFVFTTHDLELNVKEVWLSVLEIVFERYYF